MKRLRTHPHEWTQASLTEPRARGLTHIFTSVKFLRPKQQLGPYYIHTTHRFQEDEFPSKRLFPLLLQRRVQTMASNISKHCL
jgi:hypothetical protein